MQYIFFLPKYINVIFRDFFFKCICIQVCKVGDLKVNILNPKTVNSQCMSKLMWGLS